MDNSFGKKLVNLIFNNAQIVALLFVFVVIASGVAFYFFRPQGFPTFSVNIAIVTAKYPGATAAQVEDKLVKPIERAIEEVKSVEEYTASANDSYAVVTVTFKDGTQMSDALRDLDGKLASVVVPDGADKPEAQEIDVQGPTAIVAVTTDNGAGVSNEWELYRKANIVRDKLETIQGVKEVKIMNPLTPEIQVTFNQSKLDQLGLQRSQVEGILKAAQFEMPIGTYYDAQNDKTAVGVTKQLGNVGQLEELMIMPGLKLKDIATVAVSLNNSDQYNRVGRRENDEDNIDDAGDFRIEQAIVLGIVANDNEDVIGLGKRLDQAYEDLRDQSDLKPNLEITKVYDMAAYTADQLKEIKESIIGGPIPALGDWGVIGYLLGGITLVVLSLLIFVNWRVAILASLSIPLAIGITTAYLKLTGVTINTIVMFSMILVVGLVVDPTIVFLEAMQRYREQGYSGREAAIKTINSVGIGVLLSAVTNFAVFIPFGVVSGFFGQIIQYIPKTVIPAVIASFIVPMLFFLPVAAGWLKSHQTAPTNGMRELVGVWGLSRWVGNVVRGLLGDGVGKKIARTFIMIVAVIAPMAVSGAFLGSGQVKIVQFANPGDSDMVLVYGTVNERWAFSKAIGVIDPVQRYLANQAEVRKFVAYEQNGNSFTLFVELFPMLERSRDDLRTADELVDDANKYFSTIPGAEIEAGVEGAGPPEDRFPVSIQLFDNDLDKLRKAADDVSGFLRDQDGVTEVEDSLNQDGKNSGTMLILDSDNPVNLNPFAVANAVKDRLSETDVVNMEFGGETFKVITQSDSTIHSIDSIKDVPVSVSAGGRSVAMKVGDLITGTQGQQAQSIARLDGKRYVEVRAKVDKDTDPIKVQSELTKYLDKDKLKSLGLDETSATKTKGVTGSVAKSFTELLVALVIALFLIYLLLVAFFRSILSPLIIMFAVPLGFIGVFPAVAVATGELGFLELLGAVAMAGIVVNVTILIIDFANQMRRAGLDMKEAIATSITVRFKPIVLTTIAVFLGLMSLALFSLFWRGLASVVMFGVMVSALLSLITTPILYTWFDAMGKWFKRRPRPTVATPMFPTNPMQAAPIPPMNQSASPSAGLWGELPNQAGSQPMDDRWDN